VGKHRQADPRLGRRRRLCQGQAWCRGICWQQALRRCLPWRSTDASKSPCRSFVRPHASPSLSLTCAWGPQELARSSQGRFRTLYGDTKTFGNYDKLDTQASEVLEGAAVVPWTQGTAAGPRSCRPRLTPRPCACRGAWFAVAGVCAGGWVSLPSAPALAHCRGPA
jgi:hypothetical protein